MKQEIFAAAAAIVNRNMSHTFGSHILHYLKNDIEKCVDSISDPEKSNMNLISALPKFLGYMQDR